MRRKVVYSMLAILALLSLICVPNVPTKAWVYPDCTQDDKFELFGPRLDRLLINMYSDLIAECAAMEECEIDIMDWKAPWWYYDKWTTPPYDELIKLVNVSCNLDEIALKINNNKTVYGEPNPCHVSSFRHALAHMVDRNQIIMVDCGGWAIPMYTEVPRACCLEKYSHPDIWPGGLLDDLTHPYDQAEAERLLREDGFFRIPEPDGPWYWIPALVDPKQWPEYTVPIKVHLTFVIPGEDPIKMKIGYRLELKLNEMGIQHTSIFLPNMGIHYEVMLEKQFHLYLADQNLRKNPDYLYDMKHSQMYWHPGACPNYIHFNDTEYDMWAERLKCAATQEEAVAAALKCQEIYATPCRIGSVPICMLVGYKAMKRCYTGTPYVVDEEDMYECQSWKGIVNGYWDKCSCGGDFGINSWWTFLNAYPEGHLMGDCAHMTMRYGFMTPQLKSLNPIYAYDYWDWEVLNKIYDTLIKNDPYHKLHPNQPQEIPWMAKDWNISTWIDPVTHAVKTKLIFHLDTAITWQDGVPFCPADVKFTLLDLPRRLEQMGLPPPWWHMKVKQIHNVQMPDPCTVEVLFNCTSMWALQWIGALKILPKHIWEPLLDLHQAGVVDITGFAPDPNLIGTGPWRLEEYVPLSHVLLVANKPSSVVQTDLPGSEPIHSPNGYFRWCPVHINIHTLHEFHNKDPIDFGMKNPWYCTQWNYTKGKHENISTQYHLTWYPYDTFYDPFDVWNYTGAWRYYDPDAAEGYVSVSDGMLHVSGYGPPPGPYEEGGLMTIGEFNYPVTIETRLRSNSNYNSPSLHFRQQWAQGSIWVQYDYSAGGWHAGYMDTTGHHDVVWAGSHIAGIWYTLKLVVNSTNFKVYLNDALKVDSYWSPPQEISKTIGLTSTYGSYGSGDFDWVNITLTTTTYDTNLNGILDQGDYIDMTRKKDEVPVGPTIRHHVFYVETRGVGPVYPPCNVTIWTDWYSQKIYPCDEATFGITLHNQWLNPIPNTAWPNHEQVGELWVDKIVKLSVKQIIEGESGTEFPPGQYLHFQNTTKVKLPTDQLAWTPIHYQTTGAVYSTYWGWHIVNPCDTWTYPPGDIITFEACMEIDLPEPTWFLWMHPTEVQIKPTENIILPACEHHKEIINLHFKKCHYDIKVLVHIKGPPKLVVTKDDGTIPIPVCVPFTLEPYQQVAFLQSTVVHWLEYGIVHIKQPTVIHVLEGMIFVDGIPIPPCVPYPLVPCQVVEFLPSTVVHWVEMGHMEIMGAPTVIHVLEGKAYKDPYVVHNPWLCQWINCTYDFWSTIPPDIAGKWWDTWHEVGWHGLLPAGHQIQIPDCKVDMKDVFKGAKAFGSHPCHPRWEAIADLNGDYKVDMKDIYFIARNFGWKC